MNHPNITIKEADKGGTVIVLNENIYRTMIYKCLSNQNSDQNLENNLNLKIKKKIKITIKQTQNHLQR